MIIRAFAIALLLLLGAGGFHYLLDAEQQEARRQASRHLASVASLKVDQLTGWRGERLSDAIVLMHNPGFADDRAIARLMQGDAQARAAIREFFRSLVDQYGYEDVMLVNARGDILPGLGNRLQALPTGTRPLLEQAWRSRQAVLSDPLEDQAGGAPPAHEPDRAAAGRRAAAGCGHPGHRRPAGAISPAGGVAGVQPVRGDPAGAAAGR